MYDWLWFMFFVCLCFHAVTPTTNTHSITCTCAPIWNRPFFIAARQKKHWQRFGGCKTALKHCNCKYSLSKCRDGGECTYYVMVAMIDCLVRIVHTLYAIPYRFESTIHQANNKGKTCPVLLTSTHTYKVCITNGVKWLEALIHFCRTPDHLE